MKLNLKKLSMGSTCVLGALSLPTIALIGCAMSDGEIDAPFSLNVLKDKNHEFKQLESKANEKRHYFLVMLDSMSSARMYDTYQSYNDSSSLSKGLEDAKNGMVMIDDFLNKAQEAKRNGKKEFKVGDGDIRNTVEFIQELTLMKAEQLKKIEQKNRAIMNSNQYQKTFKDFNLYMNVTSPGGATHTGLLGILGGANYQIMTSEFRKRVQDHRKWIFNDAYSKIFDSIGQSDNVDKIILGGLEYYDSHRVHDRIHDWDVEKMQWSKKTKEKIIKDTNMASDVYKFNEPESVLSSLDLLEGLQGENTFNFITTNLIHDEYSSWTYNDTLMKTFEDFRKKLVSLNIWDTSEIIVVSDHGKRYDRAAAKENLAFGEMNKGYMNLVNGAMEEDNNLKLNLNPEGLRNHFPSQGDNRTIGAYNYYAAGMMAKFPHQTGDSLTIETENLYSNYDAMAQLFYDMGVDPYYLKFNYKNYMNFNDKTNYDGSWNSFVDNPLRKDLSNRKLISALQHEYYWGIDWSLNLGDDFVYFDGPYWTQENGKLKFNPDRIASINLKNLPYDGFTWMTNQKNKALETDPYGGYKVAGRFMDKIRKLDPTNNN